MKRVNILMLLVLPVILMAYGWYLGQLHQSMLDLAGILTFMTGAGGLIIAAAASRVLRRQAWRGTWWGALLLGAAGCFAAFFVLYIYARIHG